MRFKRTFGGMRTETFVKVNQRAMAIERLQILNPYMTLSDAKAELANSSEEEIMTRGGFKPLSKTEVR